MVTEPGNLLDAEIAKRVFKYAVIANADGTFSGFDLNSQKPAPIPQFSIDLNRAHDVMNWFSNHGYIYNVGSTVNNGQITWIASFVPRGQKDPIWSQGVTLPHAICIAALAAIDRAEAPPKEHMGELIKFPGRPKA
jgi:hypothetical protein